MAIQPVDGPRCLPDAEMGKLRDLFRGADYSRDGILDRLGGLASLRLSPREIPGILRRTRRKTALDVLIRLFFCGLAEDAAAVAPAVFPLPMETLCQAGLLRPDEGRLRPLARILPVGSLLVSSDQLPQSMLIPAMADFVHGVGPASDRLLRATVRKPCRSALDIGTGCGIQGMMCAPHCEQVISTDVNPRALRFARFNAALNRLPTISFRQGDLFSPVAGQRFDLIVMNPPYAISPNVRFAFRDGGKPLDGFIRQILDTAPAHLADGGLCQITAQWPHIHGEPWPQRLRAWLAGSECDAWVLSLSRQSKSSYVTGWLAEEFATTDPSQMQQRWDAWMGYLEDMGVEQISTGIINLRRSGRAANWFWTNDDADEIDENAGTAIARGFTLRDYLTDTPDESILHTAFTLSGETRMETVSRPTGEGWAPERILLRHLGGIGYLGVLDPSMGWLLGRCNGERPLIQLIDDLLTSRRSDRTAVTASILPIVRGLIERGYLLPSHLADS